MWPVTFKLSLNVITSFDAPADSNLDANIVPDELIGNM